MTEVAKPTREELLEFCTEHMSIAERWIEDLSDSHFEFYAAQRAVQLHAREKQMYEGLIEALRGPLALTIDGTAYAVHLLPTNCTRNPE